MKWRNTGELGTFSLLCKIISLVLQYLTGMKSKGKIRKGSQYLITYLLVIWILVITDKSESRVRRNAVALVKPRLLYDVPSKTIFTDFEIKLGRGKQKCKIMPLKARNHIKADTIFTGTVESFHNRNSKWRKQFTDLRFDKGNDARVLF